VRAALARYCPIVALSGTGAAAVARDRQAYRASDHEKVARNRAITHQGLLTNRLGAQKNRPENCPLNDYLSLSRSRSSSTGRFIGKARACPARRELWMREGERGVVRGNPLALGVEPLPLLETAFASGVADDGPGIVEQCQFDRHTLIGDRPSPGDEKQIECQTRPAQGRGASPCRRVHEQSHHKSSLAGDITSFHLASIPMRFLL
jgi:hypothetical protein